MALQFLVLFCHDPFTPYPDIFKDCQRFHIAFLFKRMEYLPCPRFDDEVVALYERVRFSDDGLLARRFLAFRDSIARGAILRFCDHANASIVSAILWAICVHVPGLLHRLDFDLTGFDFLRVSFLAPLLLQPLQLCWWGGARLVPD